MGIQARSRPTVGRWSLRYTGNNTGDEPVQTGSGADGTYCVYSSSDIHYQ